MSKKVDQPKNQVMDQSSQKNSSSFGSFIINNVIIFFVISVTILAGYGYLSSDERILNRFVLTFSLIALILHVWSIGLSVNCGIASKNNQKQAPKKLKTILKTVDIAKLAVLTMALLTVILITFVGDGYGSSDW